MQRIRKYAKWVPAAGWVGLAGLAVALVFVAPSESRVMGQMPQLSGKARNLQPLTVPQQFPSERTLTLLVLHRDQFDEIRTWIDGLRLRDNTMPWMKVRVVSHEMPLSKQSLLPAAADQRYGRDPWVAVEANTDDLMQTLGVADKGQAHVLVVDRAGNVLAKAQGAYDPMKADALLATLFSD